MYYIQKSIFKLIVLAGMAKSMVTSHFDDRRSLNSGFSLDSIKTKRSNAPPSMSYTASAHAPAVYTDGIEKKQMGRKSIRAIQEEVNQRMRILKSDPSEFNALEAKVRTCRDYFLLVLICLCKIK